MTAADLLADIWARFAAGVADAKHPFRNAFAATIDESGEPTVRTVVLRATDQAARTVDFHTDRRSLKYRQIRADTRVGWVFWDAADRVQVRLQTVATLHTDDSLADAAWAALSGATQGMYRTPQAPGTPLPAQQPHPPAPVGDGRKNFVVVQCKIISIDRLHLLPEGHQRGQLSGDDLSTLTWLAP